MQLNVKLHNTQAFMIFAKFDNVQNYIGWMA